MKYNLSKSKTADAETIKHLLTALACYIREVDEFQSEEKFDKADSCWKSAEKYLKGYIRELFKQNKL